MDTQTKVSIGCPIHGFFEQLPNSHLNAGCGCKNCEFDNRKNTTEDFIQRATKIHSGFYDYSMVNYGSSGKVPVAIICPTHGIFHQGPASHLRGKGCISCSSVNVSRKAAEEFVDKANKKHNHKYDYSDTIYTFSRNKIAIRCPKHGPFEQTVSSHLQGQGCPKCNSSKGELAVGKWLEEHSIEFIEQKKFPDCKYKKLLRFDFYLPNYNVCIEFDGIQHFEPWAHGSDRSKLEEGYRETVIKDGIKNKYCFENGIKLLRIPYTDMRRIPELVANFLKD